MELKALGYAVLIITVLIAFLVWVAIKHGRNLKAQEYERESQEAMKQVLKNTDNITKVMDEKKAEGDKAYEDWLNKNI